MLVLFFSCITILLYYLKKNSFQNKIHPVMKRSSCCSRVELNIQDSKVKHGILEFCNNSFSSINIEYEHDNIGGESKCSFYKSIHVNAVRLCFSNKKHTID